MLLSDKEICKKLCLTTSYCLNGCNAHAGAKLQHDQDQKDAKAERKIVCAILSVILEELGCPAEVSTKFRNKILSGGYAPKHEDDNKKGE